MIKAVVGLQFGDEGKGKFVDYLAKSAQHIVRFNGGANAGHTVQHNNQRAFFSQIPATLHHNNLYISQGALTSPEILIRELKFLEDMNIPSKVHIDPRSHIVLPIHEKLNKASEKFKGKKKIGSVGKGIGACFEDKSNRHGVRLIDLLDKNILSNKLELLWEIRERQINKVFDGELDLRFDDVVETYYNYGKIIEPYFSFTNDLLSSAISRNEQILLETSQATFLDNAFGTYPYTVAYQTLVQSCFPLMGLPSQEIDAIGVFKAYMIRVGNGPFPSEIHTSLADEIRIKGNEFGTVSNRPRRCGWLDLNLIKHAVKLNGIKKLAITNVDVLSGLGTIKVATGYELNGKKVCSNTALMFFDDVTPTYLEFESWPELESTCYSYNDLPSNLKKYLEFIEDYVGVSIGYISYGPDRNQTIEVL